MIAKINNAAKNVNTLTKNYFAAACLLLFTSMLVCLNIAETDQQQ